MQPAIYLEKNLKAVIKPISLHFLREFLYLHKDKGNGI